MKGMCRPGISQIVVKMPAQLTMAGIRAHRKALMISGPKIELTSPRERLVLFFQIQR
ncbi:hypothetical protein SAMN06265368_4777 [Cohaesibacter gelatinilyticus]|uniref:Uncharacterized protein n=1 Tax=Cohaesibacter gelatinilyticus TaxID=372072 RepID=A0A285PIU8_9HYPH|nr:hypothetical protein SAMN06265368_4777 [Cohaesibacter gelatinilyticus]